MVVAFVGLVLSTLAFTGTGSTTPLKGSDRIELQSGKVELVVIPGNTILANPDNDERSQPLPVGMAEKGQLQLDEDTGLGLREIEARSVLANPKAADRGFPQAVAVSGRVQISSITGIDLAEIPTGTILANGEPHTTIPQPVAVRGQLQISASTGLDLAAIPPGTFLANIDSLNDAIPEAVGPLEPWSILTGSQVAKTHGFEQLLLGADQTVLSSVGTSLAWLPREHPVAHYMDDNLIQPWSSSGYYKDKTETSVSIRVASFPIDTTIAGLVSWHLSLSGILDVNTQIHTKDQLATIVLSMAKYVPPGYIFVEPNDHLNSQYVGIGSGATYQKFITGGVLVPVGVYARPLQGGTRIMIHIDGRGNRNNVTQFTIPMSIMLESPPPTTL
jgi:hypothetical protein